MRPPGPSSSRPMNEPAHATQPSRRAALQGLAATALSLTPWRAARAAPPTGKLRFGVSSAGVGQPPRVATGWLSIAQSQRFVEKALADDGIEVEWLFFKGQGPAVNEALTNHQLDFTSLGDLPSIIGRSVGIQARLVMATSRGANTYVVAQPGSGIHGIHDLRGKRIGFHKGTATQLAVNRILEAHGLQERDVRTVNLEPAASLAAFQSGDLDAIFGTLSLLVLQGKGLARVIYTTKDAPKLNGGGHILVADRFAQAQPQLTQRVVTALVRAAHHASQEAHRAQVLAAWASAGSVTAAMHESDLAGLPLAHKLSPRFDPYLVANDKRSVADALRFRLIRRGFDVDAWIDARYVEAAVKELGLEGAWPSFDADGRLIGAG